MEFKVLMRNFRFNMEFLVLKLIFVLHNGILKIRILLLDSLKYVFLSITFIVALKLFRLELMPLMSFYSLFIVKGVLKQHLLVAPWASKSPPLHFWLLKAKKSASSIESQSHCSTATAVSDAKTRSL